MDSITIIVVLFLVLLIVIGMSSRTGKSAAESAAEPAATNLRTAGGDLTAELAKVPLNKTAGPDPSAEPAMTVVTNN